MNELVRKVGELNATLNTGEENGTVKYYYEYSQAPRKDVSVSDGQHIRRLSHKIVILQYNIIILTIVLQLYSVQ